MRDFEKRRAAVGERIRERRAKLGWTQLDLATRAEVDATYISLIEAGRRWPSLRVLLALAKALGLELSEMVDRDRFRAGA